MSKERTKAELETELNQLKEAYRFRVIERDHAREVRDALENENKRLAGIISEALSEKRKATPADLAAVQSGEREAAELRKRNDDLSRLCDTTEAELREERSRADYWFKANADMQKEIDRLREAHDVAARLNDELQNEVNGLRQRRTGMFGPEDELFGRKVREWEGVNAVLAKHGVGLPAELDRMLDQRRQMARAFHDMKEDIERWS